MIYLTHYRTAYTKEVSLIENVDFPQHIHYFPEIYRNVKSSLIFIPHKLADKVLDKDLVNYIADNPVEKTAFILTAGNMVIVSGSFAYKNDSVFNYTYKIPHFTIAQIWAARVAQNLNAQDLVLSDCNACASSLKVLTDVWNLINYQKYNRVIVLSVEDGTSIAMLNFFGTNHANLTYKDEIEKGVKPSAFDKTNYGFYLGQGAVLAVFESEKTKETPLAELVGTGVAGEVCTNAIGQNENGQGYARAIRNALEIGNINKDDIRIVKSHGTGTHINNLSERAAITTELTNNIVVTSYKQKIGHTLGVSGLLETCMLLDDIKAGTVPEIANRTEDDSIYLSKPSPVPEGLILSLASGMGNIYAASVFKPL